MFDMSIVKPASTPAVVTENVTINFDTTDFVNMVAESDYSITNTVDSYRSLFNETLQESSGVLNESTNLIMEQANEHVGNRIVKALQAIYNWIVNKVKEISVKTQALVTSNKAVVDKIKTVVSNNAGKVKNLKGEMHEYDLDAVKVNAISDFNALLKGSVDGKAYDLTADYSASNKEALDGHVATVNAAANGAFQAAVVNKATGVNASSYSEGLQEVAKKLRKGGARKTVSFNMSYFDQVVGIFATTKAMIDVNNKIAANVAKLINEVKTKTSAAKGDDKAFNSGLVAYYNAKRKVLSASLTAVMALNFSKLYAIIEQANEAKRFCIQAYNLAKKDSKSEGKLEEAVSEPYAPYLDVDDDFADFDDEDTIVETTETVVEEGAKEEPKEEPIQESAEVTDPAPEENLNW